MTDEQVKKGLECCYDDSRTTCSNAEGKGACPYWERFKDQICPIDWCRDAMAKDALALINRLEEEKEQIRKETAKEILQDIFDILTLTQSCTPYRLRKMINEFAEKYGVEVEE